MDQGGEAAGLAMKWLAPNIRRAGRIARGLLGVLLIIAGLSTSAYSQWLCVGLVGLGVFCLFEVVRGWCLARACGIKTKL